MVWDIIGGALGNLVGALPGLIGGGGGGGGTITVPVPKPVVPSGPAALYQGRLVVPIFTQQGVSVRPGYTQAYDTVTGRRIVVAKSSLREAPGAPKAPDLSGPLQSLAEAVQALRKAPQQPVQKQLTPIGEAVSYGGKVFQPILPEPGSTLPPGARAAIDLATGKRAVLPASAFVKQPVAAPPPPPAPIVNLPAPVVNIPAPVVNIPKAPPLSEQLVEAGEGLVKAAAKAAARDLFARQVSMQVMERELGIGSAGGWDFTPVPRGRPGVRSPVPVVGGVPARPPINLPAPRLPGRELSLPKAGPAIAGGAAGGAVVGALTQDCVPCCERQKNAEQQRRARLPRRSCAKQLEELVKGLKGNVDSSGARGAQALRKLLSP